MVEASELKAGPTYDAWRVKPLENFHALSWTLAIRHLLGFALIAPTEHNKQNVWGQINETEQTITLWPRASGFGPEVPSDPTGRQTYVSLGCVVENLNQAIAAYNLNVQPTLLEEARGKNLVGVQFKVGDLHGGRLSEPARLELMLQRRSNRGEYQPDYPLQPEFVQQLELRAKTESVLLQLISDKASKRIIADMQAQADHYVLGDVRFMAELREFLQPSDTALARAMPADTFGFIGASESEFIQALNAEGGLDRDYAVGWPNADFKGINEASGVGVILVAKNTPSDWIKAGRAFEGMWLNAEANGLGIAVLAAMVESKMLSTALRIRLGTLKEFPAVVFRIGKPMRLMPHSPRISIDDLLTPDN